jgi:hypothetical protein
MCCLGALEAVSNPLDQLAAKKAQILADAERKAAEIDADMAALQKLGDKYGLDFVARSPDGDLMAVEGKVMHVPPGAGKSLYSIVKTAGEAMIRNAHKPMELGEIYDALIQRGIIIGGKNPKNLLSAYLGQNPNLRSTPKGWWLKGEPIPGSVQRLKFTVGGEVVGDANGAASKD